MNLGEEERDFEGEGEALCRWLDEREGEKKMKKRKEGKEKKRREGGRCV